MLSGHLLEHADILFALVHVLTAEELVAAKAALRSSLLGVHDAPGSIEGYYGTAALSGMNMTPEAYLAAVEAVTAEAVTKAAASLRLHTVYLLKEESPC